MEEELIELISFIKKSNSRKTILEYLSTGVKMPSEISKKYNMQMSHVSRCLKELKDKQLVECLNEDAKKGRLYRLTDKAINLLNSNSF